MNKIASLTCHFLLKIRFYRSEISLIKNMDIVTYAFFSVERTSLYSMLCRSNPLKRRNLAIANCSVSLLSYQVMMFYLASLSQLISQKAKLIYYTPFSCLNHRNFRKLVLVYFTKLLHRIQKWNIVINEYIKY